VPSLTAFEVTDKDEDGSLRARVPKRCKVALPTASSGTTDGAPPDDDAGATDDFDWDAFATLVKDIRAKWCEQIIDVEFDTTYLAAAGPQIGERSTVMRFIMSPRRTIGANLWRAFLKTMVSSLPGGVKARGKNAKKNAFWKEKLDCYYTTDTLEGEMLMYWMLCAVTTDLRTAQYFICSPQMVEPVMQLHRAICGFIARDKKVGEGSHDPARDVLFDRDVADNFKSFVEKFNEEPKDEGEEDGKKESVKSTRMSNALQMQLLENLA
jgi:hypothetical protein